MENRLLTRERLERMIEARDAAEARKLLAECGYADGVGLEQALAQAREDTFRDLEGAVPDPGLLQVFQVKYDYHNAKVLLKARAVGADPERLLLAGGRYPAGELLEGWRRGELRECSPAFQRALEESRAALEESHDPQQADLILDRACYGEMAQLARETGSAFLQGYVRLSVDVANLRTAVRVHRMGRDGEFLRQALLPGGNVSPQTVAAARGDGLEEVFRAGALARAAQLAWQAIPPEPQAVCAALEQLGVAGAALTEDPAGLTVQLEGEPGGFLPQRQAVEAFCNAAPRVFEVGDCIRAGRVVDAVSGGYWRALDV